MATKKHFGKKEEIKTKTLKGRKKWIKPALSGKKGIVSKFAEKKGIIKAGKDLTLSSIRKVEKVATGKMKKRAIMAETLIGFNKKRFGEEGMNVEYAKGDDMYGYGGEVEGTYGRSKTPATIFVYEQGRRKWYVAEGSVNVNCTYDDIEDGVDIEELNDVDTYTAPKPINSVEDLEMFMDDEEYAKGGIMGDVFSLANKNQFKQIITIYNDLTNLGVGTHNYFIDHNDNCVVFLVDSKISDVGKDKVAAYIESLKKRSFDIIDYNKTLSNYELNWFGQNSSMAFKVYLKENIKYAKGGGLKSIPKGNKGLSKLPESVRNKMGYMEDGGAMYRTGGVAGSKHVSVTKGYRLPHGYKAVKGSDKSYTYSRGHKGVKVDAGWRLPKGYEVVEGAYNMKYETGSTLADCWSCKLDSNEKEFASSVYNRMVSGHPYCTEETLKNCDKKHLLNAIEKNMNAFSNEGKKLATSIVKKLK